MTNLREKTPFCQSLPRRRYGELLVSVMAGRLTISEVALTEREGLASHHLAEALAPELAALDRAARRLAEVTQ